MATELGYCPFCNKQFKDTLKHFSIIHDIENSEQFKKKLEEYKESEMKRKDFANYAEYLHEQEAKGIISAEDYRRLIMEWKKEK